MTENLKIITAKPNRKPADELADIREKIRALKGREETLRSGLLSGQLAPIGDEFRVTITKTKVNKIDTDKLKKELGLKFLRPYIREFRVDYVKLKKLDDQEIDNGEED